MFFIIYLFAFICCVRKSLNTHFFLHNENKVSHVTLLIWIFLCKTGKFQRIASLILDEVYQKYPFLEVIYSIFKNENGKLEIQCFSKVLLNHQAKVLSFSAMFIYVTC